VLLDEATAQSMILTAPAGYGKTTLAREWLQTRGPAAWYRATPASADVGAFSAGLAEAVAPIVPGAGERVRQRLRVGDATERLARPLAELLAEDLEAWPADAIIVLDDYHLMAASAPVETFLDWLLTLAPIRVLVTTRRRPGWATARRFLYDEAYEIGRDRLAMTEEEAIRVLEGRSTEAVHALVRQADGWPAVIGLAALSAELDFPKEQASESLYRYFAEEVLRAEPPAVQQLMLSSAVPNALTVRLIEDVLGFADPERVLLRLRDEGLLHEIPTGELVFHPLIQDFLRHRLEDDDPARLAALRRVVVDDARTHERWEEAFDLSLQAGRSTEAAEIVGCSARSLLAHGQGETLEKWLAACGAAGVTVAGAALARAELLIRKGEMSAAVAVARDTAGRLTSDHPDYAWACNATGRALHFTSQEEDAFAAFEKGREAGRSDEHIKDSLWGLVLAAAEFAPDKVAEYLQELESKHSDDIDVRFRLAVGHALVADLNSSLAGTWDRFETLLPAVVHSEDPLAASTFLATASSVAVLRGQYLTAHRLAEQALHLCSELRVDFALGACHIYKSAAEIGLRRFGNARRSLQAFARRSTWRDDPYFSLEALTVRARLLSSQGALVEALETRLELPPEIDASRPLGAFYGTLSIIAAATGDASQSRLLAELAREQPNGVERTICSSLGEAIACDFDDCDDFDEQIVSLADRCREADYIDGLVLAIRLFPKTLRALAEERRTLSLAREVLVRSNDFAIARRAGIAIKGSAGEDPFGMLTSREREVLGLLLEGLTNAEIAERLYITQSTAKVHVRHILEKLGVRSRLHAVLRAQEIVESQMG
jgi:LuxR family maltose regulon positive regulatory protein